MKSKIEIFKTPVIKELEYKKFKTEDKILQEIVDKFYFCIRKKY